MRSAFLEFFRAAAIEDDLLAITKLGEDDSERARLKAQIAALESGDPRAIISLAGVNLPDDAEMPSELLAQLPDSATLAEAANELRAKLAELAGANRSEPLAEASPPIGSRGAHRAGSEFPA